MRPLADAGPDQSVTLGSTVTLDGSQSWDPEGEEIIFRWTVSKQPAGSSLGEIPEMAPTVTIHPPVAGEYEFQLVVTDGHTPGVGIAQVKVTVI